MNIQEIITQIREKRESEKLTQKELAERIGIDRQTYARIERGERPLTLEIFLKIAEELNISLDGIPKQETQLVALPTDLAGAIIELLKRVETEQEKARKDRELIKRMLQGIKSID